MNENNCFCLHFVVQLSFSIFNYKWNNKKQGHNDNKKNSFIKLQAEDKC